MQEGERIFLWECTNKVQNTSCDIEACSALVVLGIFRWSYHVMHLGHASFYSLCMYCGMLLPLLQSVVIFNGRTYCFYVIHLDFVTLSVIFWWVPFHYLWVTSSFQWSTHWWNIFRSFFLYFVDRASQYNHVKKTNLMHNLFLVYFVNLYMFRA